MDERLLDLLNREIREYIPPFEGEKHPKDMTDEEIMQLRFTWLSDEELRIVSEEVKRRRELK